MNRRHYFAGNKVLLVVGAVVVLLGVMLVRTAGYGPVPSVVAPAHDNIHD